MIPCAFAIPGDINTLTGGFIYERRLLLGLREMGHDMRHLQLPAGFPDPSPAEMAKAIDIMTAEERPLIVDGLVFGSIDTSGLARCRAPLIAMIHHPLAMESGLPPARRDHLFATECDNLRLARHILVPSPHTRDMLVQRYEVAPERITIARPGTKRARLAHAPDLPPLILAVGILHPRKGHDILISALGDLADLDWQAMIVGRSWDADYVRDISAQIAASPVGQRINLAGEIKPERLEEVYAKASVFALATRYEGHGIVFDEALAHGLPIVSCRTGAVPDTVPAQAGLLVPPDDAPAFGAALRRMLSDAQLRTSLQDGARQAGADLPGWDRTAAIASGVLQGLAP
ncbi:glycosyltransferase family 4 protein [Paracoccus laeviglucosivorans]|uniref:Glycosyltransferase involved in cell wall bisynthesis n=1 Tax=Paracoccus laeviglucosivorans TaxID=1197861 RepID=A0A521EU36_9RHOB|nr:glycosyltransferase family 4 protein [Paracoccus laeviglucosivorans]SMO87407.1 Glycosyltransferase involved in cell wall bisynthesis [Paracoccus laeviglucosivorans]